MTKIELKLGDCLELIKTIPDKSIDMILTDPPYFKNFETNWKNDSVKPKIVRERERLDFEKKRNNLIQKVRSLNSPINPANWWTEAIRVSKKINWIVWLDDRAQLLDYLLLIREHGMSFYLLNWYKHNPTPFSNVYLKDKEIALYIYKKSPVDFNRSNQNSRTLYKSLGNSGSATANNFVSWHPTPKPLDIIKQMIEKHTQKDDIVLDLFSGSGTTLIAAKQLNRNFIGFELDETYYKKTLERLETEGSQLTFDF